MIKHIFCDLDGTLFIDKITDVDKNAILLAKDFGITFNIATGRVLDHSKSILEECNIEGYLITENGSYVYDKNLNLVFSQAMTDAQIKKIISIYNSFDYIDKDEDVIYFKYDGRVVMPVDGSKAEYLTRGFEIDEKICEYDAYMSKVGNIGVLTTDSKKLSKMIESFKEELSSELDVYASSRTTINIVPKGVSKLEGIKCVCKKESISLNEVAAIGDSPNDMSMLKNINMSFAMSDAFDSIKNVSKYETPTVADAIKMIIDYNSEADN